MFSWWWWWSLNFPLNCKPLYRMTHMLIFDLTTLSPELTSMKGIELDL